MHAILYIIITNRTTVYNKNSIFIVSTRTIFRVLYILPPTFSRSDHCKKPERKKKVTSPSYIGTILHVFLFFRTRWRWRAMRHPPAYVLEKRARNQLRRDTKNQCKNGDIICGAHDFARAATGGRDGGADSACQKTNSPQPPPAPSSWLHQ